MDDEMFFIDQSSIINMAKESDRFYKVLDKNNEAKKPKMDDTSTIYYGGVAYKDD